MPVILIPGPAGKKSLLQQGWLRVLLFCGSFLLLSLLITIPAVLLFTDTTREEIAGDALQVVSNLLYGKDLWLLVSLESTVSLFSVIIFRIFVDRQSFAGLGFQMPAYRMDAAAGFFTGTAILGFGSLVLLLSGHFIWTDIDFNIASLLKSFLWLTLIAFSEELVFRGYILNNLLGSFRKWTALPLSAILFAGFHLTNPGLSPLAFFNLVLAGILLGINYIYTRNLWFSILLHFSWNFFQGPLMGFKVSGLNLPAVLQLEIKGDSILTGGDFGLDGSILITSVMLIAILLLNLAFEKKYTGPARA